MNEKCLICESPSISGSDVSRVTEKGWKSLLKASLTRREGRDSIFRGRKTGVVHSIQCRKNYTRPTDVQGAGRKSQASCSGFKLRSRTPVYKSKLNVFYVQSPLTIYLI